MTIQKIVRKKMVSKHPYVDKYSDRRPSKEEIKALGDFNPSQPEYGSTIPLNSARCVSNKEAVELGQLISRAANYK